MSERHFPDWLTAFLDYASYTEAPRRMHFWSGVSAIAGALRRKVWFDQVYFQWYPNFYIVFVAPPGVVAKTTTADVAMALLQEVQGIKFGPHIVTWPALIESFEEATETFSYNELEHIMSAITCVSGELGNLLNPHDRDMVDLLVALWDGKQGGFRKKTKFSGDNIIENPWINIIACTTPSWIAGNVPEYLIGGGLFSRIIFIYADKKDKLVAYPGDEVPSDLLNIRKHLVEDLTIIATEIAGEYKLTDDARKWGKKWYEEHHTKNHDLDPNQFGGYIARKQSHIHKLGIVLAASSSNKRWLTKEVLMLANSMVTDLEAEAQKVYQGIGKSEQAGYADKIVGFIEQRRVLDYDSLYKYVYTYFPALRDFETILAGCIKSGRIKAKQDKSTQNKLLLYAVNLEGEQNGRYTN